MSNSSSTDTIHEDGVSRFFAFARARHAITLARRAGLPRPWTDDPILQTYRFTNVFREMDRTTLWIAEHVRRPLDQMLERGEIEPWQQVVGIILAREFNRTTTLEQIFCQTDMNTGLIPAAWSYLSGATSIGSLEANMRAHCPKPWVTGAYIIKTPDGMDKLAGALWMVEEARKRLLEPMPSQASPNYHTMQQLHGWLQTFPYLGGFTAYEVVSDLRWMAIGRDWPDVMTWACAGPGAIRGLHRIHGRDYTKGMSQSQALAEMRELLAMSRDNGNWGFMRFDGPPGNNDWPDWEMREVEHTLCEFDKYERVRLGQGRPRGVYR